MAEFTAPWKLSSPAVNPIGDRVQIRQLHISLFPEPALVIGYNIGTPNPQGIVEGKTHTRRFTAEDFKALNLPQAPQRVAALKSLVDTAYLLLNEGNHIGTGTRNGA